MKCACECGHDHDHGPKQHPDPRWISGHVETPAGDVPQVAGNLVSADRWGTVKARLGINRMGYAVPPGLYALGSPTPESPVLVSANYKMSFDRLRSAMAGRNAWVVVLDTKGINVWCAAGKGTFGTFEIVQRVRDVRLDEVVSHRTLVLPQLGAPGVAAHDVRKFTGFRAVYGPVRATDLPAFLDADMQATPEMRRVRFTLLDRLALVPLELALSLKVMAVLAAVLLLAGGIGPRGFAWRDVVHVGGAAVGLSLIGLLCGAVLTPLLLPWLPGRAFSIKGALMGAAAAIAVAAFGVPGANPMRWWVDSAAWVLILPAVSAFLAMNFTGASTFTSLSGVQEEMRYAVPAQAIAAVLGTVLWKLGHFIA